MGIFLDTSVPIKAQRMRLDEAGMIAEIKSIVGNQELGTSTIVITEMLQGISPGKRPEVRAMRQLFFDEFLQDVKVHPYLFGTALVAGKIGGEQVARGTTIPTADLMIGATALSLGFPILTTNVRHFRMIPQPHRDTVLVSSRSPSAVCSSAKESSCPQTRIKTSTSKIFT